MPAPRLDRAVLKRIGRGTLVGLVAGAALGAFTGGMAALYVPEEFSRAGLVELVLVMAGAGAVAGSVQRWLH
jgi:uncharacterized membrane protein YfcA